MTGVPAVVLVLDGGVGQRDVLVGIVAGLTGMALVTVWPAISVSPEAYLELEFAS